MKHKHKYGLSLTAQGKKEICLDCMKVKEDTYAMKFVKQITQAYNREQTLKEQQNELVAIINKIYEDGFEDGFNNANE